MPMTQASTLYLCMARWDSFPNLEAELESILSPQERLRLHNLANPRRRAQFLAGRHLARLAISKATGDAPEAIQLSAFGRPMVQRPLFSGADFNISHSGDWAAAVASVEARVGIDIEEAKKPRKALEVAKAHFRPEEIAELEVIKDPSQLQRSFYHFWTRKEGYLKGLGEGIFEGGLGRVYFESGGDDESWRVMTAQFPGGLATVSASRLSEIVSDPPGLKFETSMVHEA